MKILILCKNYVDLIGGVEYATQYLSKEYIRKGHEVHIIAHLNEDTKIDTHYHCGAKVYYITTNHTILKLNRTTFGKIITTLNYTLKSYIQIHLLKPDIVHVQHTEQAFEACLSRIIDRIPYCIAFHGEWKYGILFPKKISKLWRYYPTIRLANFITALTNIRAKEIQEELAYKPIIIPNGVDSTEFYPIKTEIDWPPKTFELITVSRLTVEKRINDVIIALSKVQSLNKNIRLTVIGDGDTYDSLRALVKELNLENNVKFTGFMPHSDIIKPLQEAHIFLIPSLYEGFPLTILEAFATCLPVIATPVSSVSELVIPNKTGFVVPFCDSDSIFEAIIKIMNLTSDEYNQMRSNCRCLAEQYDWEKVAEEYLYIYNKMLDSKKQKK